MEQIAKLKELLTSAEADAEKFFGKGNSAAGTRLRGTMQALKTVAQEVRTAVTAAKNKNK